MDFWKDLTAFENKLCAFSGLSSSSIFLPLATYFIPCLNEASLEEEIPSSQGRKAKELIDQPNTLSENQHNKSKPSHNHPIINQYDDIIDQSINTSQLHQSRLGLLSQALMMIITVGFLFSETLEEFWKTK